MTDLKNDGKTIWLLEGDFGSEWTWKEFKKLCDDDIKLILFDVCISKQNTALGKRVNKTIRYMITDYQKADKTKEYNDVHWKIVKNYNNREHSWIGMATKLCRWKKRTRIK